MTRITTPLLGEGWASSVETWCLTFWNGRPYMRVSFGAFCQLCCGSNTYRELLNDGVDAEDGRRLKGQHGLVPLLHIHASANAQSLRKKNTTRAQAHATRAPRSHA